MRVTRKLRDVNRTQVAENERLSDNIYVNRGNGVRPVFVEQLQKEIKPRRHRGR